MDLSELQNIWHEYDKKISENTRLNKEILRLLLVSKPKRRLNWIKIKAGLTIISPVFFIPFLFIQHIQFHLTTRFYIGLGLLLPVVIISFIWDIRYFILIGKVDFSRPSFYKKSNC